MEMDGTVQPEVARAKSFWMEVDVDQAFDELCEYVVHLRNAIKTCTATDREYVQGMTLITSLDDTGLFVTAAAPAATNDSFVEVVIGGEIVSVPDHGAASPRTPLPSQPTSPPSPLHFDGSVDPLSPGYVSREDIAALLVPVQLHYQPHDCSQACVPNLPGSAHYFRWHNPLKVPLLCGFQRHCAAPAAAEAGLRREGEEPARAEGRADADLDGGECCERAGSRRVMTYKAPCGKSLQTPEEVLRFLLATRSHGVLQVDYFSFSSQVRLDCPRLLPAMPADRDLSRGAEPTPVELCIGEGGGRPEDFRYRKERWPHGCFLSQGAMFEVCCDCTDGCLDAESCACIRMTSRGQRYSYQRLDEPGPTGLYECGPWCGCDRSHCQNRVVQRGLRVRLQVFQTADKGWGVRCRDDLDRGTFVCTYAGIVLRASLDSDHQPNPSKRPRVDLPSDDEVEVVTEWLAPVGKGRSCLEPLGPSPHTSPLLHVPVIQRPSEPLQSTLDSFLLDSKVKLVVVGSLEPGRSPTDTEVEGGADKMEAQRRTPLNSEPVIKEEDVNEGDRGTSPKMARPGSKQNPTEHMYYLDATKDGNVGRFLNHDCEPNLFVQNVFTDSHDPNFPMIAFFTNKVVKAGTELTWNYSHDPGSAPDQEVPCLCGSDDCQGWMV